jgi:hypothetical protein
MSETIHEAGVWWLPKSPKSSRSSGTLVVDQDGMRLESVVGPLADVSDSVLHGPEVILGRTQKSGLWTCFGSFYRRKVTTHASGGVIQFATLEVFNLWEGQHFKKPKDAVFQEGTWRYSNLHFWMHEARPFTLDDKTAEEFVVRSLRKRGALWDANVGKGITVSNDFTFSYSWKSDPSAVNFLHFDGVRIRSSKPMAFRELQKLERRFRSLVNLLADCQLETVEEQFRSKPSGMGCAKPILGDRGKRFARRDDPKDGREAVAFSAIPNFSKTVELWFAEHEKLEPIANLYLYGKHNEYLDDANQFLGVLQALERFHRTFHPSVYMPEEEYKKTIRKALFDAMPATTPPSLKDRLRSAIRFGYELSLRKRLDELADLLPKNRVFDAVRDEKFRVRTKDTRNTMVHQIANPDHPPMSGGALYEATLRWREALLALILQRLGLPEAIIVKAVERLVTRGGVFVPV